PSEKREEGAQNSAPPPPPVGSEEAANAPSSPPAQTPGPPDPPTTGRAVPGCPRPAGPPTDLGWAAPLRSLRHRPPPTPSKTNAFYRQPSFLLQDEPPQGEASDEGSTDAQDRAAAAIAAALRFPPPPPASLNGTSRAADCPEPGTLARGRG